MRENTRQINVTSKTLTARLLNGHAANSLVEPLRPTRLFPYCRNRDFVEQPGVTRIVESELVCVAGSNPARRRRTPA